MSPRPISRAPIAGIRVHEQPTHSPPYCPLARDEVDDGHHVRHRGVVGELRASHRPAPGDDFTVVDPYAAGPARSAPACLALAPNVRRPRCLAGP
jgi:hypothetical protein